MSSLQTARDDYLAVRRALGYKLLLEGDEKGQCRRELSSTFTVARSSARRCVISKKMCDVLTSYVFSVSAAKGGIDEFIVYLVTDGGAPWLRHGALHLLQGAARAHDDLQHVERRLCGSAVIPLREGTTGHPAHDAEKYKWRHLVENFFCALKAFRRIATRYEKTDTCFAAMINLVAAVLWTR